MERENFMKEMLRLLPYWHYKIDKPFKLFIKDKMSLETYYCLQVLWQNGPMTMSQICRHLKISKQQATKIIETLYVHDFVMRKSKESDRRFVTISVTSKAISYIEENIYHDQEFLERLQGKLSPGEMERLEQAVGTFLDLLPKLD